MACPLHRKSRYCDAATIASAYLLPGVCRNGPPGDWHERFVTPYASAHSWEDWAESWGHYLHMRGTLETATEYPLTTMPPWRRGRRDFDGITHHWTHPAIGMKAVDRNRGRPDAYPFVLPASACEQLRFIYRLVDDYEYAHG